ncbi:imm11 family protein [Pseudomonas eucalypticola]|uniref:Immunity MXAN-0049 protein domain-containing protein n=1 Tax=Pseudomonas eucalypticola TaxID=2599595 RepID=A0A7D5H0M8_9PSED|nr:DUF1629 domain-containing protein [Pseudomonas eucalypticola]QKZ02422.1 hypothetical protein HWQ56_00890 [Pseudomonas eucalypticola]
MKLLGIKSLVSNVGALISLRDVKGRLSKFFIWNEIDGGFLKFTVPRGEAQAGITPRRLQVVDYLETDIGIPVFSRKAKDRLLEVAPGEVEFYECVVVCKGEEYSFFLGKILKYLPLIDEQRSTFRLLAEGERLLDDAVYKDGTIAEFYMARDREFCERLVVSSQFVELCKQGGLEVGFSKP